MDEDRIKKAVLGAIEKAVDAHELAEIVRAFARGPRPTLPEGPNDAPPTAGAKRLLTRIALGDILDDSILAARPQDRTCPLRLFFGELSRLLATDADDGAAAAAADAAFTLASGLNFFFRAPMDGESKMRVGFEASRQLYVVADAARLDPELVGKAAPLLAALMTGELERLKFECVDHVKVFDSQLHERAPGSDPTAFNIVRPASFLCRVGTNNAVKVKAEVLT
ncbi:MAG: hypothetical protein J0I07_39775 [Myxococcales bacterium]|nr:hypothetical protein [Myxococcales bacterium]